MKKNLMRMLALLLALVICVSLLPESMAFADGEGEAVEVILDEPETPAEPGESGESAPASVEEETGEPEPAAAETEPVEPAEEPAPAAEEPEKPAASEEDGEWQHYVTPAWSNWSNDNLFAGYALALFDGRDPNVSYYSENKMPADLEQKLGKVNYAIEQRFKAQIEEVAAGNRTDTEFSIDVSDLDMSNFSFDVMWDIYDVLCKDCTYALYWHDVRYGVHASYSSSEVSCAFVVAEDYRGSTFEVDSQKIAAVKTAVANAKAIVKKYAASSYSDVEKLRGYMKEICLLNTYNDEAASYSWDPSYGTNPWELVYVFDQDPSTNVVCEGYSKAFEYLCNQTSFKSSKINCYCVSGINHMWNIVHMDDDRNYVVDVTWSDTDGGNPECSEAMFLSYSLQDEGMYGDLDCGYYLSMGSGYTWRDYDSEMFNVYTDASLVISKAAYGTEDKTPAVARNPKSVTVHAGDKASFSVTATGSSLKYQWYYRQPGAEEWKPVTAASGKTATYTLTAQERHNGYQYFCVVSNSYGEDYSLNALLTVDGVKPVICTQPENCQTDPGSDASFYIIAAGTDLSFQWYYKQAGTDSWTPVSAAAGKDYYYSFSAAARHNGYQYKCVVTNSYGSVTSDVVTLEVNGVKPGITAQPKSVTVKAGAKASFSVKAVGGEMSYQWYYLQPGTSEWKAVSAPSGKTANYSLTAETRHNGYQYRCVIKNSSGSVTSSTALLSLSGVKPVLVTQPKAVSVGAGETASFTVQAAGTGLNYQWYYRTSSTGSWTAVSAASGKTASYSLTTASRHNGYEYRCVVKNSSGSVTSKTVKLTVGPARPSISTQPKSVTVKVGAKANFTVKATGTGLSYQWYYRTSSSGSWTAVSAASGKTEAYSLTVQARHDGYQYRCKVSNSTGSVYSSTVTLTVDTSTTTSKYRALLIGEVSFEGDTCNRNKGDVLMMQEMLAGISTPNSGKYTTTCKYDLTVNGVKNAIQSAFADADSDDVSLFFIATHGVADVSTGIYAGALSTYDDDLIPIADLAEWLSAVPGKVIVILESCGAGAAIYKNGALQDGESFDEKAFNASVIQAFAARDVQESGTLANVGEFRTSKFYVLAACQHLESCLGTEDPSNPHNLFTLALVNGVNGTMPADTNKDNIVTLVELFNYIESDAEIQYYQTMGYQHTQMYPANSSYPLFVKKG